MSFLEGQWWCHFVYALGSLYKSAVDWETVVSDCLDTDKLIMREHYSILNVGIAVVFWPCLYKCDGMKNIS